VHFDHPEVIPVSMGINRACWHHYPQDALQGLMAEHPMLFPNFEPRPLPVEPEYAPWRVAGRPYTDSWGCVWETIEDGITGAVIRHALPTWEAFDCYEPPDPWEQDGWGTIDWDRTATRIKEGRARGFITKGSLRHGHTFLTLTYIRGYESLLFDMVDQHPNLSRLIQMTVDFNGELVRHYLELGVEWMGYPEDLGMQRGPMLSPAHFCAWIKPAYRRLMAPAREAGCVIHMHSDGDVRALSEDLLDCGVDVLNLQDLVNGIDWIRDHLKGRICIDLDVDRQQVTRFGTPAEIDALIRQEVERLADPAGGLMLHHGLMPGLPLENVRALMDAMEAYATIYSG
jgi:hypothetical protein